MTIKDLMQKLKQYPEDLEIGVQGCVFETFMSGNSEHSEKFNSDVAFGVVGVYDSPNSLEDYRTGKICEKDYPNQPWMVNFRRALCLS